MSVNNEKSVSKHESQLKIDIISIQMDIGVGYTFESRASPRNSIFFEKIYIRIKIIL